MPVYSLLCKTDSCATQFDTILRMTEPNSPCPECGGETMKIITSAPAVSLKGSGWSNDGYSTTDMGAEAQSVKADKKDRVVSYAGQKHKGRTGA